MMNLSKSEEQLMEIIWKHGQVFMKDLIESYPDPKPATTTIATLLKRMQDKGFISYSTVGNLRKYYALVKKSDYFIKHLDGLIKGFFSNSAFQFACFFTKTTNLTTSELENLKKIVEEEIKRKKK